MKRSLRIVTINTGKCDGPFRDRLRWLVEAAGRLDADVIACQEAFRADDGSLDTAGTLAAALGFDLAWAPARFKERVCEGETVLGWSGMALLSRQPWQTVDSLHLPESPFDGDRVAQVGAIELKGRRLVVANVHLTHLRDANDLRRQQLATLLAHPWLQDGQAARLICGDFNTTGDGPVLAPYLDASASPRLVDAYEASGGEPKGTVVLDGPATPGRRVDYIFALTGRDGRPPACSDTAIVLDQRDPSSGVFPSDHFGVAATLLLPDDVPAKE